MKVSALTAAINDTEVTTSDESDNEDDATLNILSGMSGYSVERPIMSGVR